jgi:hypothetical protein
VTTHLSGPVAVIAGSMDKPAAVRFLQDAGILGADAKLAEPYRNTQDGWDWPNANPAPPELGDL